MSNGSPFLKRKRAGCCNGRLLEMSSFSLLTERFSERTANDFVQVHLVLSFFTSFRIIFGYNFLMLFLVDFKQERSFKGANFNGHTVCSICMSKYTSTYR